ncbi:MAG: sugar phosphate isomerase/epimerase family protein [Eubacteriales bacterium]
MWKTKLCLGVGDFTGTPEGDIRLFHETGFDAFFTGWKRDDDLKKYRRLADELGMIYQSVHAPFGRSADMWKGGEAAENAVRELTDCLYAVAGAEVPIMVAHAFIGFKDHSPTDAGVESYGKVLKTAEHLGVKLALENTEGEEYLDYLMKNLPDSPNLGYCWDSGHEMCYNRGRDLLADYGDRLICTHLNDNLGIRDYGGEITWIDDLHLLPFDGIADWKYNTDRLNRAGYDGILTFELVRGSKPGRHENDKYGKMTVEEYIAEAYARACRVAALKTGLWNGQDRD